MQRKNGNGSKLFYQEPWICIATDCHNSDGELVLTNIAKAAGNELWRIQKNTKYFSFSVTGSLLHTQNYGCIFPSTCKTILRSWGMTYLASHMQTITLEDIPSLFADSCWSIWIGFGSKKSHAPSQSSIGMTQYYDIVIKILRGEEWLR